MLGQSGEHTERWYDLDGDGVAISCSPSPPPPLPLGEGEQTRMMRHTFRSRRELRRALSRLHTDMDRGGVARCRPNHRPHALLAQYQRDN